MAKSPEEVLQSLAPEWLEAVQAAQDDEIRAKVTEVAFNEVANQMAKEMDVDLANLKEQVSLANEPYAAATKVNKAKTRYAKWLLEMRGKETSGEVDYYFKGSLKAEKPADE